MKHAPGGWQVHSGSFSQSTGEGRFSEPKWSAGGRVHKPLFELSSLYSFATLSNAPGLARGLERFWNVGNMAYGFEFLVYDDPAQLGWGASKLVSSGKAAKEARKAASVCLRGEWRSISGTYSGDDFEGWVELYDPEEFAVRKLELGAVQQWAKALAQRLQNYRLHYTDAVRGGKITHKGAYLAHDTFLAQVVYSAHLLRAKHLPLETIAAAHLRVPYEAQARELLQDLRPGAKVDDFNWQHLVALYS